MLIWENSTQQIFDAKNMMYASDSSHGKYLTVAAKFAEECPQKKSMNKCSMSNPKIIPTSLNGF